MNTIYIEKDIRDHPQVQRIIARLKPTSIVECDHYQQVFNPKSQNFRQQKQDPQLILARKKGRLVLPTPEGFGIGGQQNYYFSHMLNCLYDCRYCFLQGMYSSANYVIFINYDEMMQAITDVCQQHNEPTYFFSGYDCDSLAYEPVTAFVENFLPFFSQQKNAILELRTKSTNIRPLIKYPSFDNCVVAYSFTPALISEQVEHKVPALSKRLAAMKKLAEHGWRLGLRFDPLIYADNFKELYQQLIKDIFQHIQPQHIHSVSVGPMRFPTKMYQKVTKLYPKDKLLAHPLYKRGNSYSYHPDIEAEMKTFILNELQQYLDKSLLFECHSL